MSNSPCHPASGLQRRCDQLWHISHYDLTFLPREPDKPSFLRCEVPDLSNHKLAYPQVLVGSEGDVLSLGVAPATKEFWV